MPTTAGSTRTTASPSPATRTRGTWGSGRCASSTRIASPRARASAATGTATWRSSATCSRARLPTRTPWGTGSTIVPGDVQRMGAGQGVLHSEYNDDQAGSTHFLQIWIEPDVTGIAPSYEQKHFAPEEKRGRLRLIASPDGRAGSVSIHQDALLYAGLF